MLAWNGVMRASRTPEELEVARLHTCLMGDAKVWLFGDPSLLTLSAAQL